MNFQLGSIPFITGGVVIIVSIEYIGMRLYDFCDYSKVSPIRKGGLAGLGCISNSELSVGSVSNCVSYSFFLLTKRPSEPFLI